MAHITIEYMILAPLLILQIFLIPYAASVITNNWTTSTVTLALQDATGHLGSSIQQLYLSLNSEAIVNGNVSSKTDVPPFIQNYPYVGNATLRTVSASSKVLNLTLSIKGPHVSTSTLVMLGQNVQWQASTFMSNSTKASINAYKDTNGTIWLSFGA
jgi:hypothetical protein